MKAPRHLFYILSLLLLACERPTITWEMKTVHDVYCPENAEQSACTVVDLTYPHFNGSFADSLNALVLRTLCFNLMDNSPCNTIQSISDAFIQEYKVFQEQFAETAMGWELTQKISIADDTPTVLALTHTFYTYTGGAHGMPGEYFINIEKSTGGVLSVDDILKPGSETAFLEIAQSKFYEQRDIPKDQKLSETGYWFKNNVFYLPENFSVRHDGLLFLYNPYEIAPYSEGMIELFIPFKEIRPFVKMKGLL